jgi:hypothetical protein
MSNRPLYKAMRKYGVEFFSIEEIEETDSPEEREIYWIEFYGTFKNGYNATMGGDSKMLYNHENIANMIKNGKTTNEIIKEVGCCRDLVYDISKKIGVELSNKDNPFVKNKRKVQQFDLEMNYLQTFDSISSAGKWLLENKYITTYSSGVRSHISEVCNNKRKTAYKFIWRYAE